MCQYCAMSIILRIWYLWKILSHQGLSHSQNLHDRMTVYFGFPNHFLVLWLLIAEFLLNKLVHQKNHFLIPAAISADAIHSQYDIPELIYEADYPDGFPIINLGAWNNDPIIIQAIKEKIDVFM